MSEQSQPNVASIERDEQDEQEGGLVADRLLQLQQLYPEAFREGQLDVDALRLAVGDQAVDKRRERYSFTWAGKRDAILAVPQPTQASLLPVDEQSVNPASTGNYFVEGENLAVLKLLYKAYANRIKLIYIDPPYNTGNDFVYPDNFREPLQQYLRVTGQLDAAGNVTSSELDRNGHKHSTWLSMMYPRLLIARQLLRADGVIFVSIDDNEVANLRLLMDEVFGEENFIASIVWQKKYGPANDAKFISETHDYVVLYAKDLSKWKPTLLDRNEDQLSDYQNPDDDPRGLYRLSDLSVKTAAESSIYPIATPTGKVVYPPASRSWVVSEARYNELLANNRIVFGKTGTGRPMQKKFLTEVKQGITPQTWWDREFAGDNKTARYEIKELMPENIFDNPKPSTLIKRILQLATQSRNNDLILDFFAGSGTTAQAVLELNREDGGNRRFILVQLPEPTGNPAYPNIAEIGKERIRRVIARMEAANAGKLPLDERSQPEDLGFRVFREVASSYKRWQPVSQQDYLSKLTEQSEPLTAGWQMAALLWELALREGYGLAATITALDNDRYRIADPERGQAMIVSLATSGDFTFDPATLAGATLFLCRDSALTDSQIANLKLQAKAAQVRFRTI